jgi:hypothetical protein
MSKRIASVLIVAFAAFTATIGSAEAQPVQTASIHQVVSPVVPNPNPLQDDSWWKDD